MHLGRRSEQRPSDRATLRDHRRLPGGGPRGNHELPCCYPERFCATPLIIELDKESPSYSIEKAKIERLEKPSARGSVAHLRVFCMSEFYKSGALLSCLIMHIKQTTDGA